MSTPTLSPSLPTFLVGDPWFTARKALSQVPNLSQQRLVLRYSEREEMRRYDVVHLQVVYLLTSLRTQQLQQLQPLMSQSRVQQASVVICFAFTTMPRRKKYLP
jgi:hypothetical protein